MTPHMDTELKTYPVGFFHLLLRILLLRDRHFLNQSDVGLLRTCPLFPSSFIFL